MPMVAPQTGPWAVLHEVRAEGAQITVSLFLLIEGPGPLSLDALFSRRKHAAGSGMAIA